jgi:hypothetical protein
MVQLDEDYEIPFGDVVALAGDHFSSIDQMRVFAKNKDGGPRSRLEIEYARKWKLGNKKVEWKDGDAKYDAAKEAQEKRYYVLAGGNEAPYGGNASHFLNPREGDTSRSTEEKALDHEKRWDDQTSGKKGQWVHKWGGVGAAGGYRLNHLSALYEAASAGQKKGGSVDEAMAQDAFACHYLTDSFAAGHVRTARLSIKEYWDSKVPMFYENLVGFMAQEIANYLVDHEADVPVTIPTSKIEIPFVDIDWLPSVPDTTVYPDADHVPESRDTIWDFAEDEVRGIFEKKAKLAFGDLVSGALHDWDNSTGVKAHVGGKLVKLVGDGEVMERDKATGVNKVTDEGRDTFNAATTAVAASVAEVEKAFAYGKAGNDVNGLVPELLDGGKLFAAEKQMPTLTKDDLADADNPEMKWKFGTWEELLADARIGRALAVFLDDKASELDQLDFEGDKKKAIAELASTMRGDPGAVLGSVINWTPNTNGGVGGRNTDDNARDYVEKAKKTEGGMASLTAQQRSALLMDMDGASISGDDVSLAWEVLANMPNSQAAEVIGTVTWEALDGFFLQGGDYQDLFRRMFPREVYGPPIDVNDWDAGVPTPARTADDETRY